MTVAYVDPSSNIRDEIASGSGMPELPEKIWFHKTASAVIDAGRCIGCGGCIAACPSRSIGVADDGKPTLIKMCTGCSACWDYCPLAGLRVERLTKLLSDELTDSQAFPVVGDGQGENELGEFGVSAASSVTTNFRRPFIGGSDSLGRVSSAYSSRAISKAAGAQDGGVVTGIVAALMKAGEIDGAILAKKHDAFRSSPFLATSVEEVLGSAGSVYHQSHPLSILNQSLPAGVRRLAYVGTPCQISVLRALQKYPWQYRDTAAGAVVVTIALFCTRSFDPDSLEEAVRLSGVDTSSVSRLDIREGQLIAQDGLGVELLNSPVRRFSAAGLIGCEECLDFAGLNADIAIGNVGSERGRSSVLVRSEIGEGMIESAASSLTLEILDDLTPISGIADQDRKRAEKTSARGIDSDGALWISYGEHLARYSGTDRSPKAPPGYRSYHFDVSC